MNDCKRQMSIMILVYGKKYSQEFSKDLFLVHFYSICTYMNGIFLFIDEPFLSMAIDSRLSFCSHLKKLCKKVANKPNALARNALDLNPLSTEPPNGQWLEYI